MDFWCTVVVAQVRYDNDIVVWERLGIVTSPIDVEQWRQSGIKNFESWSEQDWELYGSSLANLKDDDEEWDRWINKHWIDEETCRIWNYFHPYFNDDKNIEWLNHKSFLFNVKDYDACISAFRNFNYYL